MLDYGSTSEDIYRHIQLFLN